MALLCRPMGGRNGNTENVTLNEVKGTIPSMAPFAPLRVTEERRSRLGSRRSSAPGCRRQAGSYTAAGVVLHWPAALALLDRPAPGLGGLRVAKYALAGAVPGRRPGAPAGRHRHPGQPAAAPAVPPAAIQRRLPAGDDRDRRRGLVRAGQRVAPVLRRAARTGTACCRSRGGTATRKGVLNKTPGAARLECALPRPQAPAGPPGRARAGAPGDRAGERGAAGDAALPAPAALPLQRPQLAPRAHRRGPGRRRGRWLPSSRASSATRSSPSGRDRVAWARRSPPIRRYLALEQVRFEERLQVDVRGGARRRVAGGCRASCCTRWRRTR